MTDLKLRAGDAVLHVDTLGGGMRALRVGDWDILDGYDEGQPHDGRRGHILAPWPNRLHQGRYTWNGVEHTLPISDPKHDSATHGLVDRIEWSVQRSHPDSVQLRTEVPPTDGYPFDVRVSVRYLMERDRLTIWLGGSNRGREPAPFGIGMHPYFRVARSANATSVDLPVDGRLPLDDNGTPTGPVAPLNGAIGQIGDRVYDAALRRTAGDAVLTGPLGRLTLSFDESWKWLMLFTGDTLAERQRASVAVEPMTCPPNAFATGTDLIALEPGEAWRGWWSVAWH